MVYTEPVSVSVLANNDQQLYCRDILYIVMIYRCDMKMLRHENVKTLFNSDDTLFTNFACFYGSAEWML